MTLTVPWHKTFKLVAITTLLLVPARSQGTPIGFSEGEYEAVTFTLENGTDDIMIEFYASPPSTENWEKDILDVDVLDPDEVVEINIDDIREDCLYDFKAVFEDGSELIHEKVEVCDDPYYLYE